MAGNQHGWRTSTILAFVAVLLAPTFALGAGSEEVVLGGQGSPFSFAFALSPKTLPRSEPAPIKLKLLTKFGSPTGSPHPSPAGRVTVLFDRFLELSTRGLPACAPQLQIMSAPTVPKRCRSARVGRGKMEISIAFPGAEELRQRAPVLLYNGGTRGSSTRLWIYALIKSPVPAVILTPIDVKRTRQGRYGTKMLVSISRIAGGSGSVAWISLTIHRRYAFKSKRRSVVSARCPDGKLQAAAETSFTDGTPTVSLGDLVRPCTGR